jgi:hypothetical protein
VNYLSLICFAAVLAGGSLLIASLVSRIKRGKRTVVDAHPMPFLLRRSATVAGVTLAVLGTAGMYLTYELGYSFTIFSFFNRENPMTLTGTIIITDNWAQLNLDPGQTVNGNPIQGFVVLQKNPLAPAPTDAQRINAARQYFGGQQGVHYTVTGQPHAIGGLLFLLVTNAVQG